MQITDILKPGAVKTITSASSKKRLMKEICDLAHSAYGVDQGEAVEALQEREGLGPTGVGHGVALPHARLAGLNEVIGVFIRIEKSVEFESVDRLPVDLVFALFAPQEAGVEHLKALALVSRTLRDSAVRAKLRANGDPSTLHMILTSGLQPV